MLPAEVDDEEKHRLEEYQFEEECRLEEKGRLGEEEGRPGQGHRFEEEEVDTASRPARRTVERYCELALVRLHEREEARCACCL
jgi:hypothetical protein